ncbi:MAG TPA: AbrB/MazE/SpoVT family DNA-binding domain-containing protein [Candidatus Deferrimicrobium sp.]|nr:AbrB/MazE/SpoVT family DNA-binding domain-containing protein [Candidatus Deferrimicrobium sp.]
MSANREVRKVFKISNSLAVVLPSKIANEFKVQEGTYVSIRIEDDKLIIEKVLE